jgi:deoxyribose-phosphate aldolase
MKLLEYGYYDFASNEHETKEYITKAIKYKPNSIFVLPYYAKLSKNVLKDTLINVGTTIDYPFGLSDFKSRNMAVETAIKSGIDIIEMIAPTNLLCNRKYDKFRDDVSYHRDLCVNAGVELRYTLDYRVFTLDLLYKIAQILVGHRIYTVYPSSNYFLDNLSDNILASALINKKVVDLNIVVNGNAWTDKHVDLLLSHKQIYGYKTNNLYILENISHKIQQINIES